MGLIWFDAHGDMNLPGTSPTGNIHGMPLAHLLGYGDSDLSSILGAGPAVDPAAISACALMTVEGEKDDISGLGQTKAAHDLCRSLGPRQREHWEQPGVGHYGVFNGRRWREEIAPRVRRFITRHDG